MINKLKQLVKNLSVNGVLSQVSELTDRTVRFARKNTMHFIGRSIVIVVVIAGVLLFTLQDAGLYAANANITPDTDITTDFLQQTGCTATTHYNCVNDGSDSTFVNTGDTNGGDGEVEEYGLETVSAVDSASQIDVVVRARRIATGSDPDNLLINLRISGSLQTAATRTPGTTWGDLATATFTGTWTQADIDGAQIQITRQQQGGGNPSNRDDDIGISNMTADVTYVSSMTFEQSAYRWFENDNSTDVGTPLAAQDTAATATAETEPFRLRANIHVGSSTLSQSGQNFKLQYAEQSGTCDMSFVGETYVDVDAPFAQSASNTPSVPTTATNWANLSNVAASDDSDAVWTVPASGSDSITFKDFGFNIPTDAIINGFVLTEEMAVDAPLQISGGAPSSVNLQKNDTTTATSKTHASTNSIDTTNTYGTTSDLWELSWSPSDINSDQFGIRVTLANFSTSPENAYFDFLEVTVHYEVYNPETGTINFYSNTGVAHNSALTTNANDPQHSTDTTDEQSYIERSGSFTNSVSSIATGNDGMWDFVLVDNGAPADTTYCFRIVKDDGSLLNTYSIIPEITTRTPVVSQEDYRWYNNQDSIDPGVIKGDQNTTAIVDSRDPVRLRTLVGTTDKSVSNQDLRLQYSQVGQDGVCDTAFANENYEYVEIDTSLSQTNTHSTENNVLGSWSGLGNAITSDDVYTSATTPSSSTSTLDLEFGAANGQFNIGSDKIITGIVVRLEHYATNSASYGDGVRVELLKSGTEVSSDSFNSVFLDETDTNTMYSTGGQTDLWGATWSPTEINNDLEVQILATNSQIISENYYLDFAEVTVYFTEGDEGSASSAASDSSGFFSWSNPTNISANDTSYASVSFGSLAISDVLETTNYGLNVPTTATIDGIEVKVESATTSLGDLFDETVYLRKSGVAVGLDKYLTYGSAWESDTVRTYGSPTDMWGLSGALTPAYVNSSDFGFGIQMYNDDSSSSIELDYIKIKVYYSLPIPDTIFNSLDNSSPTHLDALTTFGSNPTSSSLTDVNGTYIEDFTTAFSHSADVGTATVYDFSIGIEDLAPASLYCFRLVDDAGLAIDTYNQVPSLYLRPAQPEQRLRGGNWVEFGAEGIQY